jgi:chromosome segregation ATPase
MGTNKKMSDQRNAFEEVIAKLKQERDELKLQLHLASMDAKDEYERVSGKVDQLTDQYEPVKDAVEDTAENIFTALGMVADELKVGFERVRKTITEDK